MWLFPESPHNRWETSQGHEWRGDTGDRTGGVKDRLAVVGDGGPCHLGPVCSQTERFSTFPHGFGHGSSLGAQVRQVIFAYKFECHVRFQNLIILLYFAHQCGLIRNTLRGSF